MESWEQVRAFFDAQTEQAAVYAGKHERQALAAPFTQEAAEHMSRARALLEYGDMLVACYPSGESDMDWRKPFRWYESPVEYEGAHAV
jgi:hypothetical protein